MNARLKGRVQVAVMEGEKCVRSYPWQDNLILDQGLDYVASTLYNRLFAACCAGTGTQATQRDPGTTATVSGTALTAATACFSTGDLAANVVFDTGQIAKIVGYTSPTQVTLATSLTISTATHFLVYYVNQAVLGNEVKRTVSYLTTPGACGSIVTNGVIQLYRTFLFTPEAAAITYSELGFSPQNVGGANLFSRIVLAQPIPLQGPTDELPNGQQLQVRYELDIKFDFGQGPGNYFPGTTTAPSPIANLPIQYSIWQYATSSTQTGQLAVTVSGTMPVNVGGTVALVDTAVPGGQHDYNGTWTILDATSFTDSTHGPSTTVSLSAAWAGASAGGTLNVDMNGFYFRACQAIYLVNANGQSAAPSPTAEGFIGYDEPSLGSGSVLNPEGQPVYGQIWISTAPANAMGSNGIPARIPVPANQVIAASCLPSAYVAGSFKLTQSGTIAVGQTVFAMSSFGYGAPDSTNQVYTFCYDQPHALSPGGTLQLTFSMSWARQ